MYSPVSAIQCDRVRLESKIVIRSPSELLSPPWTCCPENVFYWFKTFLNALLLIIAIFIMLLVVKFRYFSVGPQLHCKHELIKSSQVKYTSEHQIQFVDKYNLIFTTRGRQRATYFSVKVIYTSNNIIEVQCLHYPMKISIIYLCEVNVNHLWFITL